MKVSREKWERMKARGRAVGKRLGGVKGSAIDALVGVVAYHGHKMASSKGFLQTNWWAGPALMGIGGHVLKKKGKTQGAGSALLGAAGYAGMMGYELHKASQANKPAETKGLTQPSEVSGLISPADPYDLDTSDSTSSFVETSGYDDGDDYDVSEAMALGT